MSKAKRCDRCGKYYDLIPKNLPGTKTGPKYSINYFKPVGSMGSEVKAFDLCPECAQQFTEWAENPDSIFLDPNKFDRVNVVSSEELEKTLKNAMELIDVAAKCMDDCDYAMTKVSNSRVEDAINEWNTAYNRFRGGADE